MSSDKYAVLLIFLYISDVSCDWTMWRQADRASEIHQWSARQNQIVRNRSTTTKSILTCHSFSVVQYGALVYRYLSGYAVDVLLRNLVGIELDVQDRVDHPILENFGTLFGNPRHRTKYNEMKFAFLLFILSEYYIL